MFDWFTMEVSCLTEDEQVALFNDYCEHINKSHNKIYPMDMFNEVFKDKTPLEMVEMCNTHKINYDDKYFANGIFGIQTLDDPARYISYHCDDIFCYEDVWKKYIDDDDYIDYLYERLYDLKPDYMDCLVFLEIISNAKALYITEDEIKTEVIKELKKKGVEL